MKPWSWQRLITVGLILAFIGIFLLSSSAVLGIFFLIFGVSALTLGMVRLLGKSEKIKPFVKLADRSMSLGLWIQRLRIAIRALWETYF